MISPGDKFGRLTVVKKVFLRKRHDQWRWACVCDCGATLTVRGCDLRGKRKRSCNCWRRDRAGQLYRKHGKSKTVAYTMFYDARKRALALGLPFDLDPERISIPAVCPVLGIALLPGGPRDNRPSLDRRIPVLGYVHSNVHVISFRANRIKSDATPDEIRRVLAYSEGS